MATCETIPRDDEATTRPGRTPVRICMLAACPFPANHGTPGSIREMSEALVEEGYDVHIVTYHFGEDIPVNGPQVHRIPALTNESTVVVGPTIRRPIYDLQLAMKAAQVVRTHQIDVIHAHGYEAAIAGWLCRTVTRVPLVYSGHNTMSDELPSYDVIRPRCIATGLAKILDCVVPRMADRCIPHSHNIKDFFGERGLAAHTDPVVNFGIRIEKPLQTDNQLRQKYKLGDAPVVLYAGVMDRFQRLDLLLEAMQQVTHQIPNARLLFVQTIPNERQLEQLKRIAQQLDIREQVVFTSPQPLAEVRRFLSLCDVAVVPRPQTPGFPIKLLNYMAAAKPVVLFESSATGLQHLQHAWLAEDDTADSLANGLLSLLGDSELRNNIAKCGHQFVLKHHDRRLIARQVINSYELAIGQRQGVRVGPQKIFTSSCYKQTLGPLGR